MRLLDVNTERSSGFKYKLVCHFKLVTYAGGVASGSL